MASSAAFVGEMSKAAIHPLKDVAAPIRTSLSSAGAETVDAIMSSIAAPAIFQNTLRSSSGRCDNGGFDVGFGMQGLMVPGRVPGRMRSKSLERRNLSVTTGYFRPGIFYSNCEG